MNYVPEEYMFCCFKGTNCPQNDMWDLTCLLQLLICLHVLDYRNFWNNERCKSFDA